MKLIPIHPDLEKNILFPENKIYMESLRASVAYYEKIGFHPPWIGYFIEEGGELIGNGAFKGAPKGGRIELAYQVFPPFEGRGLGTRICGELITLALKTDPSLQLMARTLPRNNASTRILQKNGFVLLGGVEDPEDGKVWEWKLD
jgi:RimJ/RimL family protein N-acetyltransferase